MASYRLVGVRTPPRKAHAAMDRSYRHGSTVASVTPTDRTLGASTRQGWRLSCTPAERKAHNAVTTRNDAGFYPGIDRPSMRNIRPGKNGRRMLTTRDAVQ